MEEGNPELRDAVALRCRLRLSLRSVKRLMGVTVHGSLQLGSLRFQPNGERCELGAVTWNMAIIVYLFRALKQPTVSF